MKSKTLATLLGLVLLVSSTAGSVAQINTSVQAAASKDWQDLKDFKPGQKVLVELVSGLGDPVEGRFISATGSKLTLTEYGNDFSLDQREIERVYQLKGRWSRNTTAKAGGVIGALVGTMLGVRRAIENEQRPGHIASEADTTPGFAGLMLGGLAGAGIGALMGGKRKGKLLYQRK